MSSFSPGSDSRRPEKLPVHLVMLTNCIPPYAVPALTAIGRRVDRLTVLVSTPMESNRCWTPNWEGLDVRVQRTLTFTRPRRHTLGFDDRLFVHVPWDTIALLRRLRPDLIISGELGFRSLFSALYKMVSPRTPLLYWATLSEHNELGRGWMRHVLRKWLLRRADYVLANGASGSRYLSRLGFDERRVFSVPYTAIPGVFDQVPLVREPTGAYRLLYVGRLAEVKGVVPFTTALARWAELHPTRRIEFTVVGSGPVEGELAGMALPSNLSLRLAGERTYAELPAFYAEADIFTFPTLSDEWGLVVNEAMAAGLPVLGSVYGMAVEELCTDGKTGWTFRPDVPQEMDSAIARALATPLDELNEMRPAARRQVSHLTPEYAADRVAEAMKIALARN